MNFVVLVKQVPDTKHIPQDAWDWESGTLRRALLENVCNDLDKQALAMALRIREQQPGLIVALTMGPPFADEVLRYALSLGADHGILLTDRRLGGADTAATAYPLARAIRKIQTEIFGDDTNYLIVTGMQSVDGDTAQVPPQVAEDLGIAHIAYADGHAIEEEGGLSFRRLVWGGVETLAPTRFPCLVTVTQWSLPPYPSFEGTRWAFAQDIQKWDAELIGAERERIGLPGSRTSVVKIFPATETGHRKCRKVADLRELPNLLKTSFGRSDGNGKERVAGESYQLPQGEAPEYRGDIWVYAEHEKGSLHPASYELLGKARDLAAPLNESVGAVVAGECPDDLAADLIAHGADKVFLLAHSSLSHFVPGPYVRAVVQLIQEWNPQIFLFSATPLGRELAPRVAYASESGLTADCTGLVLGDLIRGKTRRIGILQQTRPALGGNIMACIVSQNSRVQMSTARPGVFRALERDPMRQGEVFRCVPDLNGSDPGVRVVSIQLASANAGLANTPIIVAGGLGCGSKEGYERHSSGLARALERFFGQSAQTAASRPAVESGFAERDRQVGQTGQTVAPKLYVALGISGALQHITGFEGAGVVLAVNKDADAPIFQACDYGVVGEVETVIPELVRLLDAWRKEAQS